MTDPSQPPPEAGDARRARGGKGGAEPRLIIRERERRVVTLSEQGWTQDAIAADLNVSQAAVSKILRRIDERALRLIAESAAHLRARRVRHLEYLSREGRRGWEQSKQGRVRRRQRKGAHPDGSPAVTQDVVIDEHPDPRMLDQARKAEEALVELLALATPAPTRPSGNDAGSDPSELPLILRLSTDTLERALADLTSTPRPAHDPEPPGVPASGAASPASPDRD